MCEMSINPGSQRWGDVARNERQDQVAWLMQPSRGVSPNIIE
jgi:hypothetical protein